MKGFREDARQAREKKGWWRANRWLLARRCTQLAVLGLFLLGPLAGVWIIRGNLASSLTLEILPMSDLLWFVETVAASGLPVAQAVIGAGVVAALYGVSGGRTFCSWVCPLEPVTDLAAWLRGRLGISGGWRGDRRIRHGLLVMVILLAGITGVPAWEWFNPVGWTQRGLIFAAWSGLWAAVAVFLFDLLLSPHGWCGRLCPTGAMYAQLGRVTPLLVSASRREACTDCHACHRACPEPAVIDPALKGAARGVGPGIVAVDCTRCGRCIDICPEEVFEFDFHFPTIARVVT
ncbi:MAG: quinol dehydrogenase ferredoxin subunit NapH [Magnetococcales bacterium]|nr:quinol dehydrogenase ferredoxin subunit NapH [Magnetococcales bacterium]